MLSKYPKKNQAEEDMLQRPDETRIQWLERVARRWYKKRVAGHELTLLLDGETDKLGNITPPKCGALLSIKDNAGNFNRGDSTSMRTLPEMFK